MRPKYLVMEAFGSYGKRTEIDFTHPKQNLFLITGDTGSGKSTIFKAIVFALYGRATSGDARKNEADFQSNFASSDKAPYVSLTFTVGNEEEEYRIERYGAYWHTTKKGTRTRRAEQKTLFLPDGTEYPPKEIDRKIDSLIGLTREQFMQVIMIAQGEFMKVVRADSNTRRDIFRRLFGTEMYADLTQRLKEMRSGQEGRMKEYQSKMRAVLTHIKISPHYAKEEAGEALQELLDLLLREEEMNIVDVTDACERIQAMNEYLEKSSHALDEKRRIAAQHADRALQKLTNEESREQIFLRIEEQEAKERSLLERKPEMEEKERLHQSILEAFSWKKIAEPRAEAARDLEQSLSIIEDSKKNLPEAEAEVRESEKRADQQKKSTEEAKERFRRCETEVRESRQILSKREEVMKAIRREEKATAAARESLESLLKEREALEEEFKNGDKRLLELGDTASSLLAASGREEALSEAFKRQERVRTRTKEMKTAAAEAEEANREYQRMMASFIEQERKVSMDRKALLDEQAGILAQGLKEGEPCPVCGSKEHPSPAMPTGDVPTKEILEKEEEELRESRKKLESLSSRSGEKKSAFIQKKEQREEALHTYFEQVASLCSSEDQGILLSKSLEEADAVLETEAKALKQQKEKLQENHEEALRIKKRREKGEEKLDELAEETAEEERTLTASKATQRTLLEQLENLEKPPYENLNEVEALLHTYREEAEKSQKNAEQATLECEEKKKRALALQNRLDMETNRLPELKKRLEDREASAEKWMREHTMTSEQAEILLEEHSEEEAETLRTVLNDYQDRLTKIQSALAENRLAVGDAPRPNLEILSQEKNRLAEEKAAAENRYYELIHDLEVDRKAEQDLMTIRKNRLADSKRYDAIQSLYRSLSGNTTGGRMDIETYIQRRYLSEILHAANERFTRMTDGQFEMRMESLEKAGEGKNRGLDLIVYSAVTGKEREISSLSGGESFMAALSLALGIGDSIQARSMSIPLDIMFIDEGFGSLDSTSLGEAVRVLQEMTGNQKLIGIISHVETLKQVTDDQLLITKDENGSSAKWV